MKKKLLIIFLHGFGDNIMATPAVRELSQIYDVDIAIYDKTLSDKLWKNLNFINHVYKISLKNHPRYWNPMIFWLKDYWVVKKEIKKNIDINNYDKIIFSKIYLLPHFIYVIFPFLLKRYHKIDQIAYELGIEKLENKKTELGIPKDNEIKGEEFLFKNKIQKNDTIITLHLLTVAKERDFPLPLAQKLINYLNSKHKNLKFIILGSNQTFKDELSRYKMNLHGDNIIYTYDKNIQEDILTNAYLIKKSQLFIGVDSGPFHIAGALKVNTIGIFRTTRIKSNQRAAFNENMWCHNRRNLNLNLIEKEIERFIKNT